LAVAVLEEQVAIKEVMVLILFLALLLLLAVAGAVETTLATAKMVVLQMGRLETVALVVAVVRVPLV
jgi:hypothetical protein